MKTRNKTTYHDNISNVIICNGSIALRIYDIRRMGYGPYRGVYTVENPVELYTCHPDAFPIISKAEANKRFPEKLRGLSFKQLKARAVARKA